MRFILRCLLRPVRLRDVLPPTAAVFLSLGILLLNKEGLDLLAEPLVVTLIVLLAAASWYLFRPRDVARKNGKHSLMWRTVVPIVVLLAGPGVAVILWVLEVFVIEHHAYRSTYERLEQLPPCLGIGMLVGVVSSVVALIWATCFSRNGP